VRDIEILQMAKVREIKILHTSKSTGTSNYDNINKMGEIRIMITSKLVREIQIMIT